MQPLVSIITINLNNAEGLKATVNSVISQEFRDFELIIIDGASVDGSRDFIERHAEHFSHWISEADQGIYYAQNKGIEAAKGQYLLFLNSGDCLNGHEALGDFVNAPEFKGDIIYGDYKFQDGGKQFPDVLSPLFFFKSTLPHQSTLFKKSVFEQMGGYDTSYRIAADRAHYVKCYLSQKFEFSHVPQALSLFDLTGVSNDPAFSDKNKEEDQRLLKEQFRIYYSDYLHLMELKSSLSVALSKTPKGILKRLYRQVFH